MKQKLVLACMAVVALAAFVVMPAAASATPRLCETVGTECKTISEVGNPLLRAHNVGTVKFVSGGSTLWECTTATLTGKLTQNNAEAVKVDIEKAEITGTEAGGKCKSGFGGPLAFDTNIGNGVPWCLTASGAEDKFTLRGNSCALAQRSITFVLTTTNIGTCKYSRAESFTGTYTTHSTGDAIVSLTPTGTAFTKEEGSVLCPASYGLELSLTLETDVEGTSPLYIENV